MKQLSLFELPVGNFDARDNDYWWRCDTNDYTAEANRYNKPVTIPSSEPAIPPDPTGWYRRSLQQARAEMEREAKRLAEYDAQVKLYRS